MARWIFLNSLFSVLIMTLTSAWAQTPTPSPAPVPAPVGLGFIIAATINTGGVMLVVYLLNKIVPKLRAAAPWAIPIIASLAVGPALVALQSWLANVLGAPIDLSQIAGVFATGLATGGLAVASHQVYKNA